MAGEILCPAADVANDDRQPSVTPEMILETLGPQTSHKNEEGTGDDYIMLDPASRLHRYLSFK